MEDSAMFRYLVVMVVALVLSACGGNGPIAPSGNSDAWSIEPAGWKAALGDSVQFRTQGCFADSMSWSLSNPGLGTLQPQGKLATLITGSSSGEAVLVGQCGGSSKNVPVIVMAENHLEIVQSIPAIGSTLHQGGKITLNVAYVNQAGGAAWISLDFADSTGKEVPGLLHSSGQRLLARSGVIEQTAEFENRSVAETSTLVMRIESDRGVIYRAVLPAKYFWQ